MSSSAAAPRSSVCGGQGPLSGGFSKEAAIRGFLKLGCLSGVPITRSVVYLGL